MSEIIRHIEGFGTVRAVAYWVPISWVTWDDYDAAPAEVPLDLWTGHHGHHAALRQSAFGTHGFHCSDCNIGWSDGTPSVLPSVTKRDQTIENSQGATGRR